MFKDGVRRIDMILAYDDQDSEDSKNDSYRRYFENNLRRVGLHLELEDKAVT